MSLPAFQKSAYQIYVSSDQSLVQKISKVMENCRDFDVLMDFVNDLPIMRSKKLPSSVGFGMFGISIDFANDLPIVIRFQVR